MATVDDRGAPQLRTLVLRQLEERLALFVNATSPKWQELTSSPTLAVVVWLHSLQRQWRLQVRTEPVPGQLVAQSWQQRPHRPKQLDWYYNRRQPQSRPVRDREALLGALDDLELPQPLTAPPEARGLYLNPLTVERLDLDTPEGVHDRRRFEWLDGHWQQTVLVP